MKTSTGRRRPSARTALLAAGGIGLAVALGGTMAQWTDSAVITGEITTGEFEIVVTPDELGFDEFAPGAPQTSEHTLTNDSTVPAHVDLTIAGFPGGGPDSADWELTVRAENAPVGDGWGDRWVGDPGGGVSGISLGAGPDIPADDLVLQPGESLNLEFVLELNEDGQDGQNIALDDVTFTFNGTQVVD